jgi:hypothetical protein
MSSDLNYAEMVKQAEAAVASIRDSDLKNIAFSKVLDALLAQREHPKEHGSVKVAAVVGKRTAKSASKRTEKRGGPVAYVEELIDDGFFKAPKTLAAVKAELANRGHHIPLTALSGPMQRLCQRRQLRRQKLVEGNKQVFTYSHW